MFEILAAAMVFAGILGFGLMGCLDNKKTN